WPRMVRSTRVASLKLELPDVLEEHVDLAEHLAALVAELGHLALELRVLVTEAPGLAAQTRVVVAQAREHLARLADCVLQLREPRQYEIVTHGTSGHSPGSH